MNKTKIVRGKPLYMYEDATYLEMPKGVFISKMCYDNKANITYVYCKKNRLIFEIICINIIVLLIAFNWIYVFNQKVRFRYNSIVTHYDGVLYLNLLNESNSYVPISYNVRDTSGVSICSGVLNKGESLISVETDNQDTDYTIYVTYEILGKEHTETYNIKVANTYGRKLND